MFVPEVVFWTAKLLHALTYSSICLWSPPLLGLTRLVFPSRRLIFTFLWVSEVFTPLFFHGCLSNCYNWALIQLADCFFFFFSKEETGTDKAADVRTCAPSNPHAHPLKITGLHCIHNKRLSLVTHITVIPLQSEITYTHLTTYHLSKQTQIHLNCASFWLIFNLIQLIGPWRLGEQSDVW